MSHFACLSFQSVRCVTDMSVISMCCSALLSFSLQAVIRPEGSLFASGASTGVYASRGFVGEWPGKTAFPCACSSARFQPNMFNGLGMGRPLERSNAKSKTHLVFSAMEVLEKRLQPIKKGLPLARVPLATVQPSRADPHAPARTGACRTLRTRFGWSRTTLRALAASSSALSWRYADACKMLRNCPAQALKPR